MQLPLFICLTVALFFWETLAATTVRVATYNVENYLSMDLVTEDGWRPDYPKSETSKAALRVAIVAVNPDVLALQEIGSAAFLREFQRDLRSDGIDFPNSYLLEANDADRHVAVLSRVPFAKVYDYPDLSFPYFGERQTIRRGLLEVEFFTEGERWSLFVLHLKSKWTERADDPEAALKRTGEATAARDRILARHDPEAGALFLIAGDFNDTRNTAPLRRFLTRADLKISEMLPAFDSQGETWTHHWQRQDLYSRVDYLLLSPAMRKKAPEEGGHVYDGPDYRIASDHRMVWADLHFGDADQLKGVGAGEGERLATLLQVLAKPEKQESVEAPQE